MINKKLLHRFYPQGYEGGTERFFKWIDEYVKKDYTILDLGAGPAANHDLKKYKERVKDFIGADIDPVVMFNKDLDSAFLIMEDELPFDENSIDLIYSDYVLEHIEKPIKFLTEIKRVLKPGGSFFFRTPNHFHYVTVIARLTPHWIHLKVANKVRGLKPGSHDPYKTFYKMNSQRILQTQAKDAGFKKSELKLIETEPSYLVFNSFIFLLGVGYERIVNRFSSLSFMRANIFGRFEK